MRAKPTSPRPLYWTAADQAELDVLVCAFVDAVHDHRPRCAVCAAGGPWCDNVRVAFEAILDWRRYRALFSRAERLREEQAVHEALLALTDEETP